MAFTTITMKDLSDTPPSVNTNVQAKTRVCSDDQPDHRIAQGTPARQQLRLRNKVAGQNYVFRVVSTSQEPSSVSYSNGDPSMWEPPAITIGGPRGWRGAKWAKRSTPIEHPGTCAPGNAHTIQVAVEVGGVNPLEAPAFESHDLFYEVTCQC